MQTQRIHKLVIYCFIIHACSHLTIHVLGQDDCPRVRPLPSFLDNDHLTALPVSDINTTQPIETGTGFIIGYAAAITGASYFPTFVPYTQHRSLSSSACDGHDARTNITAIDDYPSNCTGSNNGNWVAPVSVSLWLESSLLFSMNVPPLLPNFTCRYPSNNCAQSVVFPDWIALKFNKFVHGPDPFNRSHVYQIVWTWPAFQDGVNFTWWIPVLPFPRAYETVQFIGNSSAVGPIGTFPNITGQELLGTVGTFQLHLTPIACVDGGPQVLQLEFDYDSDDHNSVWAVKELDDSAVTRFRVAMISTVISMAALAILVRTCLHSAKISGIFQNIVRVQDSTYRNGIFCSWMVCYILSLVGSITLSIISVIVNCVATSNFRVEAEPDAQHADYFLRPVRMLWHLGRGTIDSPRGWIQSHTAIYYRSLCERHPTTPSCMLTDSAFFWTRTCLVVYWALFLIRGCCWAAAMSNRTGTRGRQKILERHGNVMTATLHCCLFSILYVVTILTTYEQFLSSPHTMGASFYCMLAVACIELFTYFLDIAFQGTLRVHDYEAVGSSEEEEEVELEPQGEDESATPPVAPAGFGPAGFRVFIQQHSENAHFEEENHNHPLVEENEAQQETQPQEDNAKIDSSILSSSSEIDPNSAQELTSTTIVDNSHEARRVSEIAESE